MQFMCGSGIAALSLSETCGIFSGTDCSISANAIAYPEITFFMQLQIVQACDWGCFNKTFDLDSLPLIDKH